MWLDDDGDEPIGGEIPDPSTRQWRHPSEIAAEAAAAAAAAAPLLPEAAMAGSVAGGRVSSSSIFWPISVVGGCIAVAALGVFGLYLTGEVDPTVEVASATTLNSSATGLSSLNRNSAAPESLLADDEADALADGEERPDSLDSQSAPRPSTTTTIAPSTTVGPTTTVAPSTTTTLAPQAAEVSSLLGPAIYSGPFVSDRRLASVVPAGGHLLTSASAMGDHVDVSLRIGGEAIAAVVSHVDPVSDVAVITPLEPIDGLFPPTERGPKVTTGLSVYLGYCEYELLAARLASIASEASRTVGDDGYETVERNVKEPGCNSATLTILTPVAPEDAPEDSTGTEEQQDQDAQGNQGGQGQQNGNAPEPKDKDRGEAPDQAPDVPDLLPDPASEDRKGKVYSVDQPAETASGRLVYEPIRTGIPQKEPAAGSPLRDASGDVVGLVLSGTSTNLAALPIGRAIAVGDALTTIGIGSPAWIGMDVVSTPSGIRVVGVDEGGPADGLVERGDLIDKVNGNVVIEADHLEHLVRKNNVGKSLGMRVMRGDEVVRVSVDIVTAPTG